MRTGTRYWKPYAEARNAYSFPGDRGAGFRTLSHPASARRIRQNGRRRWASVEGEYYRRTKLLEVAVVSARIEAIQADFQLGLFLVFLSRLRRLSKFLDRGKDWGLAAHLWPNNAKQEQRPPNGTRKSRQPPIRRKESSLG